jgi:hypothetical protein
MGNILNEDFRDFILALNAQQVKYMLVRWLFGYLHGYSRTTGDMDIWVERTADNYSRILLAFHQFGMPVFDMTEENFLNHPTWDVFTFGTPPVAIDLMVNVKGLDFDTCFRNSVFFEEGDLKIRTIQKGDLIRAKKSTSRPKDLDDLDNIQ